MLKINIKTCSLNQLKLFQAQLQSILSHVTKQNLTFQQSNIKFISSNELTKLRKIFSDSGNLLPLRTCLSIIQLHSSQIVHNRPVFYVSINSQTNHSINECFNFWKQFMEKKYGSRMRWFSILSGSSQAKKVKSFQFKIRIKQILKGTTHQNCCQKITQKFVKNTKNEIQWGAFVSVLRFTHTKHSKTQISLERKSIQNNSLQKSDIRQYQNSKLKKNFQSNDRVYLSTATQNSTNHRHRYNQKTKHLKNAIAHKLKQNQNIEGQILLRSSQEMSKQYESVLKKLKTQQGFQGRNAQQKLRVRSAKNPLFNKQLTAQTTLSNWRKSSLCNQPKKNSKFSQIYLKKMQQQKKQSEQKAILDAVKEAIKKDKDRCQTQIIFIDQQF